MSVREPVGEVDGPDRLIRPEQRSVTSEVVWRVVLEATAALPALRGPIVVVAPHPDDETLGAGGLIAQAARLGVAVEVVACSDGESAYPGLPGLGSLRRRELRSAVDELRGDGTVMVRCLGLGDGRLADRVDALAARLRSLLAPAATIVAPWPGDGHPDHAAVAQACRAARAAEDGLTWLWYPVWGWHWAGPDELVRPDTVRLLLDPSDHDARRRAIARHRSQVDGIHGEPILTPAVLEHFDRPYDTFLTEVP